MYVPKYFKVNDVQEVLEFIQANSFGTLVTIEQGKPIATHLPLMLRKIDNEYYLTGHLAYGNPQWRTLEMCKQVLVMFQGPHAYISSSWYSHENVPTWNYQSVHVYGKASILDQNELIEDLTLLLKKYEEHRENGVLWETLSQELIEAEIKGIVGFKVKVEDVQAAYKLSQNRNESDYNNIIAQLRKEGDVDSKRIADVMEKWMNDKK